MGEWDDEEVEDLVLDPLQVLFDAPAVSPPHDDGTCRVSHVPSRLYPGRCARCGEHVA